MPGDREPVMIVFEIVTKGGHAIPSEPEEWPTVEEAVAQAATWMKMKGQSLTFTTIDGGGAVVQVDEVEHVTTTPEKIWLARQTPEYLESIGVEVPEDAEA